MCIDNFEKCYKNLYNAKEKEKKRYGSSTAANSAGNAAADTQSTTQNNVRKAEQSTPRSESNTLQKRKREKSPSELGEEVLALMLSEETPKTQQPAAAAVTAAPAAAAATPKNFAGNQKTAPYGGTAAGHDAKQNTPPRSLQSAVNERAAAQTLSNAGLDENAIRGAQWGNSISNTLQKVNERAEAIRATPEWQPLAAAQNLTNAGLDENALKGLEYGDGLFRLNQKADAIRATPEWQALAAAQNLAYAGLNENAQWGFGKGQPMGKGIPRFH